MIKRYLKEKLPKTETISQIKVLKMLNLARPSIWHFSRRSVATAFFIGMFWTMMPMPFQMLPATIMAIYLNANLPVTLALVWITNPLTIPFIFYLNYRLGVFLLGDVAIVEFPRGSWQGVMDVTQPLLLGCLTSGFVLGLLSYLLVNYLYILAVRINQNKRVWRKSKGRLEP